MKMLVAAKEPEELIEFIISRIKHKPISIIYLQKTQYESIDPITLLPTGDLIISPFWIMKYEI